MSLILFILAIFSSMFVSVPPGSLACVLTPISGADCRNEGGAGLAEFYVTSFDNIQSITWGTDEEATAITLNGGATWTKYEPEPDTSSFNQEKQIVGRTNLNFVQTLSLRFTNNNKATRAALREADRCCDNVFLLVDNQGQQRLAGVMPKYNSAGDTIIGSTSLRMRTAAGSYNTGADPAADENVRELTWVANAPKEAPYTSVDVTALSLT